jgi:hypothetical protein
MQRCWIGYVFTICGVLAATQAFGQDSTADARADLSDLSQRLTQLVQTFDHAHASQSDIERVMGVTFAPFTSAASLDYVKSGHLMASGYKHLAFDQYFNLHPRQIVGRQMQISETYTGVFTKIPFDNDRDACLSYHDFGGKLLAQGWKRTGIEIHDFNALIPPQISVFTTDISLVRGTTQLDLTTRDLWKSDGTAVGLIAGNSPQVSGANNDCIVMVEIVDTAPGR